MDLNQLNKTIEPHRVTKPIQLLAVWMSGLILLVGSFLTAAVKMVEPSWLPPFLSVAAFIMVLIFIIFIFLMQTKFRPEMQDDLYYSQYLERQEEVFKNFKAENTEDSQENNKIETNETWRQREQRRIKKYEKNNGLFLIHTWRPSISPGQLADIVINLAQHGTDLPTKNKIESVEYHLGPKFFKQPIIKTNAQDNFRLEVSAYGPMLCFAKVNFVGEDNSLELERYINF